MRRQRPGREEGPAAPAGSGKHGGGKPLEEQLMGPRAGSALRVEDFGGGPQAVRIINALDCAGVRNAAELLAKSDSEILKMRNMGKKALERIHEFKRALASGGRGAIILREDGAIMTNLSPAQVHTIFRLAKLELEELRETVVPEKVKVIGELLDMVVLPGLDKDDKRRG